MSISVDAQAAAPALDTIWYTRCPVPTASGVAIDTGQLSEEFAADGIGVASLRASTDASVRESHFDHNQAALFREGGNVPALWARSRGQATRLIGLTWVEEFQSLIVRPDSGIREPRHLAGKRILLPTHGAARVDFARAMALRGLDSTLRLAGLTLDDVELVDVATPVSDLVERRGTRYEHEAFRPELDALRRGDGDAFYGKGSPAIDTIRTQGLVAVSDLAQADDPRLRVNNGTPRTITVSEELLSSRPDLVTRYLAVLLRAASWAAEHPAETHAILASETGAPVEAAAAAYGDDAHRRLRPRFDIEAIDLLTDQKNFLLLHGFLDGDVDVQSWLDPAPFGAALELAHDTVTETGDNS
ncbi:MAG: hypothetical protein QOF57_1252 [Frankiaceae bacterium]|jgi:ABC-type nitrate/sulfonate/bicarbonate transport system substrate-binding protein|nr:hypothetical protein [Frankiaceae bacterium]MDQ1726018.1 hypothetical protein [Frankiaceae bacterium]